MEDMIRVLVDSSTKVSTTSSIASLTTLPTTLDEWVTSTSNAIGVPVPDVPDVPPPRADSSEEDDDYLVDAANGASMKQIIYHDEEERLRRQESLSSPGGTGTGPSPNERRESDTHMRARLARREKNNPIPTQRGDLLQEFGDPVLLGYLTEQEGRHLFDLCVAAPAKADKRYFQGAHAFLPVFDKEKDTWDRWV